MIFPKLYQFYRRFRSKCVRIVFRLCHAPKLNACGAGAHLYSPFRLDGAESISLGKDCVIQANSWLYCNPMQGSEGCLEIGGGCVLGYNNHITAVRKVVFEDYVLTANNIFVSDNLHSYEDVATPILQQPIIFKAPVVIGRGSWLGENVCVIGASIGKNCVIGANSVVTQDIPDYSIAVGAPAVVIKQYDHDTETWVSVRQIEENK